MSYIYFVLFIIVLTLAILLLQFGSIPKAWAYLKEERGILKGVAIFILASIVVTFLLMSLSNRAHAGWLEYTEIFIGIDQPKNDSPMCKKKGVNDRLTSNGGLRQNIFVSDDNMFHVNAKYTHHSCAFNADKNTYDAFGLEASYRIEW